MLHLTHVIDRAVGAVFVPPPASSTDASSPDFNPTNAPPSARPNTYALFSSASGAIKGPVGDVRDVQERWIDAREEWDAWEKKEWRREGELVAREKSKAEGAGGGGRAGQGSSGGGMGGIRIRERNA